MLTPQTYYAILFLVSAYAFLRGRSDERIAVATCILATFATNFVYSPTGSYVGRRSAVSCWSTWEPWPLSPSWRFGRTASGPCGSPGCS